VCILPFHERIELELYHFIESSRNPQNVYKLNELAWSKIGYILGFLTPISNELPKDIDLAFQKYYADHIWTITLVDMLNVMEFEKVDSKIFHNEDITYELNKGKFENQDVHGSFKSVYISEIQGILDVHRDTISNLLENIYLQDTGKSPTNEEKFDTSCYQMLSNLIYSAFRLNKIRNQLPSIRIGAGLHAAVRWDKHRKYQANDLYDFKHAIAALPYFDLFFTECSLCHLVDDGNLKYKDLFACKTVYKPSDALSLVVK
jgi:hypothetical protein